MLLLAWELPLLVLTAAAAQYWRARHTAEAPVPALGLRLWDTRKGQLRAEWRPDVARAATVGKLDIRDGIERQEISLTPEELAAGAYTYSRSAERVDVRLTLFHGDGTNWIEESGFLGQVAPIVSQANAGSDLLRQTSELEAEEKSLRSTSQRQTARLQQLRQQVEAIETKLGIARRE